MKWSNIIVSILCVIALVLSCVSATQVKVIKGEKGDQGEQGIQGIQGEKGEKGDKGDQGIQGVAGLDGRDGIDGKDGADGKDGVDGKDGEKGDKGEQGIQGVAGKDGKDGDTPYIKEGFWWIGDTNTHTSASTAIFVATIDSYTVREYNNTVHTVGITEDNVKIVFYFTIDFFNQLEIDYGTTLWILGTITHIRQVDPSNPSMANIPNIFVDVTTAYALPRV